MPTKPTQRTLAKLKSLGVRAGVVEKFNPHVGPHGIRQDLFHFIDIVALDAYGATCEDNLHGGILAIQACSGGGGDAAARVRKIQEDCYYAAADWLACLGRIQVWAWRKTLKPTQRGTQKIRYVCRIIEIDSKMLQGKVDPADCVPAE